MKPPLSLADLFKELASIASTIQEWLASPEAPPFEPYRFSVAESVFQGWFPPLVCRVPSLSILATEDTGKHGLEVLFSVDAQVNPFLHGSKRMQTAWVTPAFKVLGIDMDLMSRSPDRVVDITMKRVEGTVVLRVVYFPNK